MNCKPIDVKFSAHKESLETTFKDVGVKGASAYEIAVMRGFKGTVDEWLESLHGKVGEPGKDGKPFTYADFTPEQLEALRGPAGKDGYTPQKGVDYFDGKDGKDGENGQDGYIPQKGIDYFDGAPGKDGQPGADGYTPVRGKDYWTADDQKQIVADVLATFPVYAG